MAGWTIHEGRAVHLPQDNIDTDQIIPARFMSVPRDQGYGDYLMHDLRCGAEGLLPDFPLNRNPGASILIAGRNFGSGSSREAAVYALVDAGFRVVIAPSFGDIFAGNAVNNGLLAARMQPDRIGMLVRLLDEGNDPLRVDLDRLTISRGDTVLPFDLDETWRMKLRNGWDDIDLTLRHEDEIASFRDARKALGWTWPAG